MKLLLFLLLVITFGCKNECEEKGGKVVISHFVPQPTMMGKTMIMIQSPRFKCELPDD